MLFVGRHGLYDIKNRIERTKNMPEQENLPSRKAAPLEPQTVKLPARPTFEKKPEVEKEEHKRWPKPKGRYRPIKDLWGTYARPGGQQ